MTNPYYYEHENLQFILSSIDWKKFKRDDQIAFGLDKKDSEGSS